MPWYSDSKRELQKVKLYLTDFCLTLKICKAHHKMIHIPFDQVKTSLMCNWKHLTAL